MHTYVHVRSSIEGKLSGSGAAVQGTQLLMPGQVPQPHPTHPSLPVIMGCGKNKDQARWGEAQKDALHSSGHQITGLN